MDLYIEREVFRYAAANGALALASQSIGMASLNLATAVEVIDRTVTSPRIPALLKAKTLAKLRCYGKDYGIESSRVDGFEAEAVRIFNAVGYMSQASL